MIPADLDSVLQFLGLAVVASPVILLALLGLSSLAGIWLSEGAISRLTQAAIVLGLVPAVGILGLMLLSDRRQVLVDLGDWVHLAQEHAHFRFQFAFVFDRLSLPMTMLVFVLCGVVGRFSRRYLHREEGYRRFFVFYAIFLVGMVTSVVAGTIETLFLGWELVGLSSALLVAYFHASKNPVRNGHRIWSVYRVSDAAFLLAAIAMHHMTGEGDFSRWTGAGSWPEGVAPIDAGQALFVGLLLLVAAAGKSALVPFSGWLPRAMEGPTPSSAVFYGALSVHLGVYLLLRTSPILDASWVLSGIVVAVGIVSAVSAALMARVQSDAKNALAFASLTQVGIIVVEIGLGLRYLALVHILGHACLRTLQLLRAPSLLLDYHAMENAMGTRLTRGTLAWPRHLPATLRRWVYRFGFERGHMDTLLDRWVVEPFQAVFQWADRWERRWTDWLSGEPSRESDTVATHPESSERAA